MTPRLLFDVTQFVNDPVTTGIQRTLLFIARDWPSNGPVAEFGFADGADGRYTICPRQAFQDAAEWIFGPARSGTSGEAGSSGELVRRLADQATDRISAAEIPARYDAYMLPELTYRDAVLETVESCRTAMGRHCLAIAYDALPQTHPAFFPGPHQGGTSRYFLTVGRLQSLAFISEQTRRVFEGRIRRSPVPNALTLPLGADAMGRGSEPVPPERTFVVIGTIEPRKRHQLILEAFDRLWADGRPYRLRFIGGPGHAPKALIQDLSKRTREHDRFEWWQRVTDEELRAAIRSATGALFVSELEGYGLPPLEALALGTPVVVSAELPSLEGIDSAGQVRLATVTVDAVAEAVDRLASPVLNAEMRAAMTALDLPGWRDVVGRLAGWAAQSIEGTAAAHAAPSAPGVGS